MVGVTLLHAISVGVIVGILALPGVVVGVNWAIKRTEARSGTNSGSTPATFHVGRGPWIAGEPGEPSYGNQDSRSTARSREELLIDSIEAVARRTTWADSQQLILEMITNYRHGRDPS